MLSEYPSQFASKRDTALVNVPQDQAERMHGIDGTRCVLAYAERKLNLKHCQ